MRVKHAVAVLAATFFFSAAIPAAANTGSHPGDSLEPLEYKSLPFRKKTEYLHDSRKVEMKNTLTEAQVNLNFSEPVRFKPPIEVSDLFLEPGRPETGTAAAKAAELGLFTESQETAAGQSGKTVDIPDEPTGDHRIRTYIFIGFIGAAIFGLFGLMIPALLKSGSKGAPTVRHKEETEGKHA